MNEPISRRSFLKITGLTIAVSVTPFGYDILNASAEDGDSFKPSAWFELKPDNKVTVFVGATEMGQGIRTCLAMIVADELEADWKQVRVVQADAHKDYFNPVMHVQVTVASSSTRGFYEPLRKAGAAGRAMLVGAAAQTWKVPEGECTAFNGTVKHKKSNRSLTYGQLALKAAKLELPKEFRLKKESEFRYMGKPMPRVDIPEKVSGKAIFGLDVSLPDMLYGVLARPPAYEAKPLSFDQNAAEKIKGVKKVVPTPNGIAVIAESLDAAWKGREALKVQWDKGSHPEISTDFVEKHYMDGLDKPGVVAIKTGDAKKAIDEAAKKLEAVYYVPFIAHAPMEPMNATAHVQSDRCDVWVPTQGQTVAQMVSSKLTGLPPEKVHIHTTYVGCGLGRRTEPDFTIEAVLASKAVGKPVKVVWTREEDIKYDFFRAAAAQRVQAGLDSRGHVTGWNHKVSCTSILRFLNPAWITKEGVDLFSLFGILDVEDPKVYSRTNYEFPNWYVEQVLSDLPIPASPWRSVQNAPNAFVVESFMDELAHAAGKDPVEFRMHLLSNNMRARRVLQTVAEKAGWGKPMPKGKGRGISQHACFGAYLAQVAEVSVNEKDGTVKVDRIVTAVDVGPVVNPDPLIAQIEGAAMMAMSTIFKEKIEFANGGVKSANFDDYNLITMKDTPEIEVHIVKSTEPIGGIGEPGVTPTAPAIGNAIFNATGGRIRRLPMTPETVLAAIKKA